MLPLIFAGVLGVASATGTYLFTRNHYEAKLAERTAEHANQLAAANANALAETQRLQKAKDEAERKAATRIAAARRDAAVAGDALVRLSHASDSAIRSASDSHSSCQSVASTSTDLLQQCSARYRDVAAAADGWLNEAMTLRDAWPR
jgi:CCR4-NOT transcriptional regulation complex NOT5 subunit